MQIEDERRNLESLRNETELQKSLLESQRDERVRLIDITRGQEEVYQNYIQAQELALASVEDSWKKADEQYQN